MTTPLPPSGTTPTPVFDVTALQYGESFTDPNGHTVMVEEDTVLLRLYDNGTLAAVFMQPPTGAIGLARMLVTAAGNLQARQVDNDGNTFNPLERLKAFDQAWKGNA